MPQSDITDIDFRRSPAAFLSSTVMSGYRLNHAHLESGRAHVYLVANMVNGERVVTLETNQPSGSGVLASPIPIWWVPQGGSCEIPVRPGIGDPRFVFTADFSGCSFLVDQLDADQYRVYHVTGGDTPFKCEYQPQSHGLGIAGFVTFTDYGAGDLPRAFICMQYVEDVGRWMILAQSHTGFSGIGGTRGGPLLSLEAIKVRSAQGRYVSDLSKEQPDRDPAEARHGSLPLVGG